MGEISKLVKRKVTLILKVVESTPHDSLGGPGAWAACRLLLDDIDAALDDPELPYKAGQNFNLPYVKGEASHFRGYVDYYFGLGDFDDVAPGETRNLVHFAHKLTGLIPS